jgi:HEAT repeat protein
MKRFTLAMLAVLLLSATVASAQSVSVVDTSLGQRMQQLFPELSEGYIDLNANGQLDRFQDMDERVPESRIQDNTLQVQEILDFIIENFRFFTVERLEEVRTAVQNAEGEIPEIIAISYGNRLAEAIEDKREFGADDLYLPPSVLRRAQEEMAGYIATMIHSFRKEEGEFARRFAEAREQLFSMMEAGYPLPNIGDADESLLASAMIHTIITTGEDDPQRVKAAIRTLGRMQAEEAIPQLEELLDSQAYRIAAAEALGDIGNNTARNILTQALEQSRPGEYQNAVIRAVGRVGGGESAELIIGLAEETRDAQGEDTGPSSEKMLTVLDAMADLAEQGSRDRQIYQTLSDYLEHPSPDFREVAVEGIASYGGRNALGLLQPRLQQEQNEEVLVTLVEELASYDDVSVLTSFTNLLDAPGTTTRVQEEIITAIGGHANGSRVVTSVMDYLSHESDSVRETAAESIAELYTRDGRTVVGRLSRAVTTSDDPLFLTEATDILGDLADPASLTALLNMLGSPYEDVRKNATWGLYRIRPAENARVAAELQTLVTSEAEPLEVRINAVRALGAMGQDSARLEVEKTLATTLRLRSPEYAMLRYYAVRALAEMPSLGDETLEALVETAASTEPELIRAAALETLTTNGIHLGDRVGAVTGVAQRSEDVDVQLAAVELLGDMAAPETVGVADAVLEASDSVAARMQVAYALSRVQTEDAVSLLITLAGEEDVRDLAMGFLRDADERMVSRVVERRLQTEDDEDVRAVLEQLRAMVASGN